MDKRSRNTLIIIIIIIIIIIRHFACDKHPMSCIDLHTIAP